jgi:LCP family protein required for cell wall assembly
MTLVVWLVIGVVVGVIGEQIVHAVQVRREDEAIDPALRPDRPKRKRSKRKIALVSLLALVLVVVAVGVGSWFWARARFDQIERVEVGPALRHGGGSGTNYLLGKATMMSIPRDLWVTIADSGREQKINAAFNGGPQNLIRTIDQNLGIPVDRYMEISFDSFGALVDSMGGVTIDFPHPAFDTMSGLNVTESGPVTLNGEQALAYVRSRHYTEVVDGKEVPDNQNDFGRQARQQTFLRVVLAKLASSKNPITLATNSSKLADGLRIDDEMRFTDAVSLGWDIAGKTPEPVRLPVLPFRAGGQAALELDQPEADKVLAQFEGKADTPQ